MGEVERYPDGSFCWIDLSTTDVEGAKAFYGRLLGWEFEDLPAPEGSYTMCRLRGREVAGIHRHAEEEGTGWSSSVSVGDLDRPRPGPGSWGPRCWPSRSMYPGPVARRCFGTRPGRWCRCGRPAGTPGPGW